MNFYEEYLIKLQKRIKRIEENPDLTKLKSNKIRYEIEIELVKEQLEGIRKGKPFSDGGSLTAGVLVRAMGFIPVGGVTPAFQTTQSQKYLDQARDKGLPVDKSCDMTMMPFAMMESGDVPMEDLAVCDHHCCTPMMLRGIYVAHSSNTLTYFIDRGVEENEATLKYVTDQLGEFIEFAERKFPGVIKYDEDKLIEMQGYEDAIRNINREIYEMTKDKPSITAGRSGGGGAGFFGAGPRDVEYALARRDEVAERIAKGFAAIPDQKASVLWTGVSNPVFMDPYQVLANCGIATPRGRDTRKKAGITDWGDWGRELSPLEKVAARAVGDHRGGLGDIYVEDIISHAREAKVDGIVNYNMRGCVCALGLKRVIEERAEKELGIPVLQLEGAQWDQSYADEATITEKLVEFSKMLLSMKDLA